jgi:hypothetical protein
VALPGAPAGGVWANAELGAAKIVASAENDSAQRAVDNWNRIVRS